MQLIQNDIFYKLINQTIYIKDAVNSRYILRDEHQRYIISYNEDDNTNHQLNIKLIDCVLVLTASVLTLAFSARTLSVSWLGMS